MSDERDDTVKITAIQKTTNGELLSRVTWETWHNDVTEANVFNMIATKTLVGLAEQLGQAKADNPAQPGKAWDEVALNLPEDPPPGAIR